MCSIKLLIDKIRDYIKKNDREIQVFLVVALVIVTMSYANSTQNMVKIMEKEFYITNRPYLNIEKIENRYVEDKLFINLYFKNRGKIPARIENIKKLNDTDDLRSMVLSIDETRALFDITLSWESLEEEKTNVTIKDMDFDMPIKIEYYSLVDEDNNNKYCIEYLYHHEIGGNIRLDGVNSFCE